MTNLTTRRNEQGNALFLILIAVVLFAALSYAITQSNRGGGAPNRETSLISSTTVTQYSSAIRTGITRMLLRNAEIANIDFTPPTDAAYSGLASDSNTARTLVFHPDGGGVSYAPVDYNTVDAVVATVSDKQNGNWHFVMADVDGIGTDEDDLVAMLDDIKKPLCERINEQITGSKDIPTIGSASTAFFVDGNALLTGGTPSVIGQSFMCIKASDHYIYYHVIAEQ